MHEFLTEFFYLLETS